MADWSANRADTAMTVPETPEPQGLRPLAASFGAAHRLEPRYG